MNMYILGVEVSFATWLILAALGSIVVFIGLKELLDPGPDD